MSFFYRLLGRTLPVLTVLAIGGCATGANYETVPQVPLNVTPTEESDIEVGTTTTFQWRASARADYYEFHLFNRTSNDINQYYQRELSGSRVCNGDTCSVTVKVNLPLNEDHAWRVRAGNNIGLSGWSRTRFNMVGIDSVSGALPNVPSPMQPAEGTALKANSLVDFIWLSAPDATTYDFHLFDSTNQTIVDEVLDIPASTVCQGGSSCQLTRKVELQPADNHAWRVRAHSGGGTSEWTRIVFAVTP